MPTNGFYAIQAVRFQALIEGEVSLPVGKPEMARVVLACGRAETGSVESLDGAP